MKKIITEDMRFRQRVVEYAIKQDNNSKAAKKYHTSRQQVSRWRMRYDGTLESLRPLSRRPHSHPNSHREEEVAIIKHCYQRYGFEGLAEVYVQCMKRSYSRSFGAMKKMIRRMKLKREESPQKAYLKSTWKPDSVSYPGEKVQIDIKYVPQKCIGWDSHGKRYYQITALDEYSRKRICTIVDEKSVTHTAHFLLSLEKRFGFKITTVQTDNGREFTNDPEQKERESLFEKVLRSLGMKYKKTRPYSPWQNGKVERSHREDGRRFFIQDFKSLEDLLKKHQGYVNRGNNIAREILGFQTPNQVVSQYFERKEGRV